MSTILLGSGTFLDLFAPAKGKSEWGMDTLTRKMSGARSLLPAFIAGLAQGQLFQGYYLQTWEPDDDPNVATVTLNYKGLQTGGTPQPDPISEFSRAKGSISKSYATENDGKGRVYKQNVWRSFLQLETGAQTEVENGQLPVYTTGCTMEFVYYAVQTTYRYIRQGKPDGPQYTSIDIGFSPSISERRYTTADGSVYGKNAPSALTADLQPVTIERVVGFTSKHVIGSPYYECEDIVRGELGEVQT